MNPAPIEQKQIYSASIRNKAFPFLILAIIIASQYYYDIRRSERPLIPPTIIPAQILKFGDLGLHSAASSLMWIYTIQQVGTHPKKIPDLIKVVNDLDPKFGYPYAFAVLILPPLGFKDGGVEIALRGVREVNTDWKIPYYLATTYHIFFEDRKNALFYFDIVARMPNSPQEAKAVASRYGTSKTVRDQTKDIWASIYETSNDELVKERASRYIIHIDMLELLEKAALIYRQKYGYYPKKIAKLVQPGILKEIPLSPLGLEFYLDESGRALAK